MVEDFDVLGAKGLFFLCTSLRIPKQGINSFISLTLSIINPEVVSKKFWSPAYLSRAQILRVHEMAKVIVVGEYKHLMLKAF